MFLGRITALFGFRRPAPRRDEEVAVFISADTGIVWGKRLDGIFSLGQGSEAEFIDANQGTKGIHVLLDDRDIRTFLTEKPDVMDEALGDALKWSAKEQSDIPIDDISVSFTGNRLLDNAGKHNLFLYCTKKSLIRERAGSLFSKGIPVLSVTVSDDAWRNLVCSTGVKDGLAIVVGLNSGKLLFVNDGEIVLSRKLPFSEKSLSNDEGRDKAIIDIQRGLDFMERQYSQFSIDKVVLSPNVEESFREMLQESVNSDVILPKYSEMATCENFGNTGSVPDTIRHELLGVLFR